MGQQRITLADIIKVADRLGIYDNIHRYGEHSAELWCDGSENRRVTFTFDGPVMTIERTDKRPVILDAFPDDGEGPGRRGGIHLAGIHPQPPAIPGRRLLCNRWMGMGAAEMLRLKNILTALALAAAGFAFLDAALDAAVWEIDHAPRLTPEQIRAECAAHYTPACAGKRRHQ